MSILLINIATLDLIVPDFGTHVLYYNKAKPIIVYNDNNCGENCPNLVPPMNDNPNDVFHVCQLFDNVIRDGFNIKKKSGKSPPGLCNKCKKVIDKYTSGECL